MRESDIDDVPETPAHLFALRALRTAFFGTPAVKQDETLPGDTESEDQQHICDPLNLEQVCMPNEATKATSSPIKSILLTPGTVTAHRKTVTFSEVRADGSLTSQADSSGHRQLARRPTSEDIKSAGDTVRRSLFQTQPVPAKSNCDEEHCPPSGLEENSPTVSLKGSVNVEKPVEALEVDQTTDLKSPKSRSGRHWKSEYQREHDKTRIEMKRLIMYSQVARSYAAKRDGEATLMREKLEEAEGKVQDLERKVLQLAAELGNARLEGDAHEKLVDDLAVQTANAVRYKQKAAWYRTALRDGEGLQCDEMDTQKTESPPGKPPLIQPYERVVAPIKTEYMTRLEEENGTLKNTIARVKEEMQRYEERHRKWQENRRRRDERWATKRKELEEQLAKYRHENHLLHQELQESRNCNRDESRKDTGSQPSIPARRTSTSDLPAEIQVAKVKRSPNNEICTGKSVTGREARNNPKGPVLRGRPVSASIQSAPQSTMPPKRQQSLHLPDEMIKPKMVAHSPQEETLDLWGLAESTGNRVQRSSDRQSLQPAGVIEMRKSASPAVGPPAGEALWENLKRRTSLSFLGKHQTSPLERPSGGSDAAFGIGGPVWPFLEKHDVWMDGVLDKENVQPGTQ